MRNWLVALTLSLSSFAFAASLADANTAFAKGDVANTLSISLSLNNASGLIMAAKVTTYGAVLLPENQREAAYDKATDYARRALAVEPNNAEAHMELARALGRGAQFKGILQSLGIAGEVRSELETTIRLDPKIAAAYVALGLWHAEVPLIAGGRNSEVEPNILKAITLEPNTVIHRMEYANALMKVSQRNKKRAIAQLEIGVKFTPKDFWEKLDLENAKKLLASMR